jgi:hypothetical protein
MKFKFIPLFFVLALPALAKETFCQRSLRTRTECLQKTPAACETFMIHEYTFSLFVDLNKYLWNAQPIEGCEEATQFLNQELQKVTPYVGTTYRGDILYPIYTNLKVGDCLKIPAFLSTTMVKEIAVGYATFAGQVGRSRKRGGVFQFDGFSGRDIDSLSSMAGEREVLFPKGSLMKLIGQDTFNQLPYFHFQEVLPEQCSTKQ